MDNNLDSNVTEKLMRAFIPAFDSQRKVSKLISTNAQNLVEGFDETTGDSYGAVRMKRPLQFVPQRTADGDFTGKDMNPVKVGSVPAEVGQYCTVFVEMTDIERALKSADVAEEMTKLVAPAAEDMCNTIESELTSRMMKAAAITSGSPAQAIAKWQDVAQAGTMLKAIGLPSSGKRYCVINEFDSLALAGEQKGLAVNPEVASALRDAAIASSYAGFDTVLTSDNMPSFTSGDIKTGITVKSAPVQTYDACKDSYQQTLVLTATGSSGKILTAGTTLVIQGVNMVHLRNHNPIRGVGGLFIPLTVSVLENATFDSNGDANVKVSGCSIFEAGVNGAYNTVTAAITAGAVVVIGETNSTSYAPGLAFHEAFFGMGSIKLKKLDATDSSFTSMDGLNFRVSRGSDIIGNKHKIRIDFRPTFACLNPFFGEKVYGNA